MGAKTFVLSERFGRIVRMYSVLLLLAGCAVAAHAEDDALSAKAIQFANENIASYKEAVQYAGNGPKAEVPVPPEIAPQCHVCGDATETKGETDVDQWVKDSMEPEAKYAKSINSIALQLQSFRKGDLSDEAKRALNQFGDEQSSITDIALLAQRNYRQKALPMAEKYDSDPQRAYAGIDFLMTATKDYLLSLDALPGKPIDNDKYAFSLAMKWMMSISTKIDEDIFQGKKYNLCPAYVAVLRQLVLLGASDPDMDALQKTVDKIEKMMYFDVNFHLHVHIIPKEGSGGGDETWSGTAKLHLNIDFNKSCYTPEYADGGKMAVTVRDFSLHDDEGNPVTLMSSRNYIVPLGQPKLNLCDPGPMLDTGISSAGVPDEEASYKGKTIPWTILSAFLNIASIKNSLDLGQPLGTGVASASRATPAQGSDFVSATQRIEELQKQMMAHSSDPNWINSPDGQAAMAAMQSAAAGAQKDAAAMNQHAAPQRPVSQGTVRVPWTNGKAEPVNRSVEATGDDGNLQLKITVENAPQE